MIYNNNYQVGQLKITLQKQDEQTFLNKSECKQTDKSREHFSLKQKLLIEKRRQ